MAMSDDEPDKSEGWFEKAHRWNENIRAMVILGVGLLLLLINLRPGGQGHFVWWSLGFVALGGIMLYFGRRKK